MQITCDAVARFVDDVVALCGTCGTYNRYLPIHVNTVPHPAGSRRRFIELRGTDPSVCFTRGDMTALLDHVELAGRDLDPTGLATAALKPLESGWCAAHVDTAQWDREGIRLNPRS